MINQHHKVVQVNHHKVVQVNHATGWFRSTNATGGSDQPTSPGGSDQPGDLDPFEFNILDLPNQDSKKIFTDAKSSYLKLDEWGKKNDGENKLVLGFDEANFLRKTIYYFLSLKFKESFFGHSKFLNGLNEGVNIFYLPDAKGGPRPGSTTKIIEILGDEDKRTSTSLALKALSRYRSFLLFKKDQEYSELREDEIRLQVFLDEVEQKVISYQEKGIGERLGNLMLLLERQSAILGVEENKNLNSKYNFQHLVNEFQPIDTSVNIENINNETLREWTVLREKVKDNFKIAQEEFNELVYTNAKEKKGLRVNALTDIKKRMNLFL